MIAMAMALLASYVIGSIPTGYLLVKWLKRVDVRTVGSGNIGATNVTRVAGPWLGRVVFLLDVAKGLVAVWIVAPWFIRPLTPAAPLLCGVMAVIGHMFPVFLQFHGGKGVATTIGVLCAHAPGIAIVCVGAWVLCFMLTRYVSVASLVAVIIVPIAQAVTHRTGHEIVLGAAMALLIVIKHRSNLERLRQGREYRFGGSLHER